MRRLVALLAVALPVVGCGGGGANESTANVAPQIAALANKVGGPLKVADTYAREHGTSTAARLQAARLTR